MPPPRFKNARRVSTLMKRLLLLLLFTGFAFAEMPPLPPAGDFSIIFQHVIFPSQPVQNKNVLLVFKSEFTQRFLSAIVGNDSKTNVLLDAGEWAILSDLDDPLTPGKDLVAKLTLNVSGNANATFYYQKVGTVLLSLEDEKGQAVEGAKVEGSCVSDHYAVGELNGVMQSDSSGSVLLKFVPTGNCVFSVKAGSNRGSKTIAVGQGAFVEEKMTLKAREDTLPAILMFAAAAVLALTGAFFVLKRRAPRAATTLIAHSGRKREKHPKNGEFAAVYKTLSENERKVMDLLHENRRLKQSKIFKSLLIPKTTLIRTVDSLQRKGLVKATPLGNTRLVEIEKRLK